MIDPLKHGAAKIGQLPMALTHVRTLESFEGPLLAEFRSDTGDAFLYSWCDREGEIDRWIVVRTPTQDLTRYLVRVATLRELITKCHDGFVYLLDLDQNDLVHAVFFIESESLPSEYVPSDQSFYDSVIGNESQQQDVFVNG